MINNNQNGYHVWTRGKLDGQVIDDFEKVRSLERAVVAGDDWLELQEIALDPELQLIVSNTTEQGLTLNPADGAELDFSDRCPGSYPAKLLALLFARFRKGMNGLTILPLELVEYNAVRLLALVKQQAAIWPTANDPGFLKWLETENRWLSNLVDRIVVGIPASAGPPPWGTDDPLAVIAEPFRMLAIKDDGGSRSTVPGHEMVQWVDDLDRLFVRKVRILNGLHTAMVAHSMPLGFETVLEAVTDSSEREWLESLLNEEILPALSARGIDESGFAGDVMERFENPFFQHRLADIANGHAKKIETRIEPTIEDFKNAFGRDPVKLVSLLPKN